MKSIRFALTIVSVSVKIYLKLKFERRNMSIQEFFGFGGYQRPPEGYFSWQHLLFVTALMVVMVFFAVYFGMRNKTKDDKEKNKVIIFSAFFINALEITRIILLCFRSGNPMEWIRMLPSYRGRL